MQAVKPLEQYSTFIGSTLDIELPPESVSTKVRFETNRGRIFLVGSFESMKVLASGDVSHDSQTGGVEEGGLQV
jgi:hypothetical protein